MPRTPGDVTDDIDPTKGPYQHAEREVVEAFYRAGQLIACAHAVFPVRDRKTGKWFPVLVMFDQDGKKFSYAFGLDDDGALNSLVGLLEGARRVCAKRNGA